MTAFDDSDRISRDEELRAAMNGFIMADEFILDIVSDDDIGCYEELAEQYLEDTGQEFDSWYIQGYNAVRMIADTAVICEHLIRPGLHRLCIKKAR